VNTTRGWRTPIDSPCECEHNNPDSLDARLFFTVVLAVAPAVTMDEASSLSTLRHKVRVRGYDHGLRGEVKGYGLRVRVRVRIRVQGYD